MPYNRVIIPNAINPPPSSVEVSAAKIFASHYKLDVEFLVPRNSYKQKTPDFIAGGMMWEIKSPRGASLNSIEKHIVKGLGQAINLIIDTRNSKITDARVVHEILKLTHHHRKVRKLLILNKNSRIQEVYIKGKRLSKLKYI